MPDRGCPDAAAAWSISLASRGRTPRTGPADRGAGYGVVAFAPFGFTNRNVVFRDLHVSHSAQHGMDIGGPAAVKGCTVASSGSFGISAVDGVFEGNLIEGNGSQGLSINSGGVVRDNVVRFNGGDGVSGGSGNRISGNTVSDNGDDGVDLGGAGNLLTDNVARSNVDFGFELSSATSGYANNVLTGNRGGAETQVASGTDHGDNICGTDTACP